MLSYTQLEQLLVNHDRCILEVDNRSLISNYFIVREYIDENNKGELCAINPKVGTFWPLRNLYTSFNLDQTLLRIATCTHGPAYKSTDQITTSVFKDRSVLWSNTLEGYAFLFMKEGKQFALDMSTFEYRLFEKITTSPIFQLIRLDCDVFWKREDQENLFEGAGLFTPAY